jgi:hypothetical protein
MEIVEMCGNGVGLQKLPYCQLLDINTLEKDTLKSYFQRQNLPFCQLDPSIGE